MSNASVRASLHFAGLRDNTSIYELHSPQFHNKYFILSGEGTRRLMAFPETVGFDNYLSLLPETVAALRHLFPSGWGGDLDILTILRGGLNYPLEEACHRAGIRVRDMDFLSCERIIKDNVITGLEIKYDKLRIGKDRTLAIGDIIATGDTMKMCLERVVEYFHERGGSLRKIIFFTIGGTRAVTIMEDLTPRIKALFPGFEGFECFFYEGMFTVYEEQGVCGINLIDIDFGWKGGVVSPGFRRYVMEHPYSLFERCIIYDGGARRYEIPVHFEEVLGYWEGILERVDSISPIALTAEKLGYEGPLDYAAWLEATCFTELPSDGLQELWKMEQDFCRNAAKLNLREIITTRIKEIKTISQSYE